MYLQCTVYGLHSQMVFYEDGCIDFAISAEFDGKM